VFVAILQIIAKKLSFNDNCIVAMFRMLFYKFLHYKDEDRTKDYPITHFDFQRFKGKPQKAYAWLNEVRKRDPSIFVHWERMGRVDQ